ncbi:DNA repair protein RecO [Neomegalonema perideroedes]|uniref:DNA repair protein RecO n=1 Tax=Neomegalonema perideroedes TaxID=217219 RepID=UPI000370D327|nr:DNA repair protein RecO [Neomegalonema perideroedes]
MEWRDAGIALGLARHGEGHALLDVLTAGHGRWRGYLHGGGSRKRASLQPGDLLDLVWRARLEDQLGSFRAESLASPAARALDDGEALAMLSALCALCLRHLPEREPAPGIHAGALELLAALPDPPRRRAAYAHWELRLLAEIGFGLDFTRCALGGPATDLGWVSPRSGRAADRALGAPWAEKLLPLPVFLRDGLPEASPAELRDALRLTGHFLGLWAGRQGAGDPLPPARLRLAARAERAA